MVDNGARSAGCEQDNNVEKWTTARHMASSFLGGMRNRTLMQIVRRATTIFESYRIDTTCHVKPRHMFCGHFYRQSLERIEKS